MAAVQIAFDFESRRRSDDRAPRWSVGASVGASLGVSLGAQRPALITPAPQPLEAARTPPHEASHAPSAASSRAGHHDKHDNHDKLSLELQLRANLELPLRLSITDNRRTMISLRKQPGFMELRLHHMFLTADAETIRALCRYVGHGDRQASALLGQYIEQHRGGIRKRVRRLPQLSTAGVHHDLLQIFSAVSTQHFQGRDDLRITWGRAAETKRWRARRSIKLGSYCSRDKLIRIHPALDAATVPRFFVEYIVYHEMLHHVLPPSIRAGRRQLHGRDFKRLERQFPEYAAALAWERENLDWLLCPSPRR